MDSMWQTVAEQRGALADDLSGLPEGRWSTESLCTGWTVEDVLAHMTSTAAMNPVGFFREFAQARFDFPRFARAGIERHRGATPAETLAAFRAQQHSTSAPPGPKVSWLGETIVHSEDIRRPLGLRHTYPAPAVLAVLDFYKGSNTLIGTKRRIHGLRLQANDADWSHGSGPELTGPALSLLMAATGRRAALSDLEGPGVDVLRRR